MATDREKILAEIERMRADADGRYARADRLNDDCGRCDSVGRDTACGQIKSFITALPAAEEVEYWAVYIPGYDPSLFRDEDIARKCADALFGEVYRVAIRKIGE
jgi:hypothetical protein